MDRSSPIRICVLTVLLFGLIIISKGLFEQLLKFSGMILVAFVSTPETSKTLMSSVSGLASHLAVLFVAGLTVFVVARWTKTPLHSRSQFLKMLFLYEALMVGVIVVLFPFFWMFCTSFKPSEQVLKVNQANPFDVLPTEPTLDNFKKVFKMDQVPTLTPPPEAGPTPGAEKQILVQVPEKVDPDEIEAQKNFGTYFLNSMKVSTTAAFFVTFFAAMAGYVFSKKDLPGKGILFKIFMGTMMIPGMMYMVPQFFIVCQMGLFGTQWAMFLPHLASVFGVFMLKQYMDTIPNSLIEAARIDGASEWQIFRVVIIPLCMPILLTLFLLTFLFHWSNFLWQLIVTDPEDALSITLPVGLALFRGQYTSDLGLIMSASCFSIVPITVLFLIAQRYFIEGMTQGGVKE